MALTDSQQQVVDALRPLVGETSLDDDSLFAQYEAAGSLNLAAASVWSLKASTSADLVDVREGSSTRPLSQLRGAALAMEAKFRAAAADEVAVAAGSDGRTRTRAIVRRLTY